MTERDGHDFVRTWSAWRVAGAAEDSARAAHEQAAAARESARANMVQAEAVAHNQRVQADIAVEQHNRSIALRAAKNEIIRLSDLTEQFPNNLSSHNAEAINLLVCESMSFTNNRDKLYRQLEYEDKINEAREINNLFNKVDERFRHLTALDGFQNLCSAYTMSQSLEAAKALRDKNGADVKNLKQKISRQNEKLSQILSAKGASLGLVKSFADFKNFSCSENQIRASNDIKNKIAFWISSAIALNSFIILNIFLTNFEYKFLLFAIGNGLIYYLYDKNQKNLQSIKSTIDSENDEYLKLKTLESELEISIDSFDEKNSLYSEANDKFIEFVRSLSDLPFYKGGMIDDLNRKFLMK